MSTTRETPCKQGSFFDFDVDMTFISFITSDDKSELPYFLFMLCSIHCIGYLIAEFGQDLAQHVFEFDLVFESLLDGFDPVENCRMLFVEGLRYLLQTLGGQLS